MCKCCSNGKDSRRKKHYAFLHGHTHSHEDAGHSHEHSHEHGHEHHHPSKKSSGEMAAQGHGAEQGLQQK